MPVQLELKMQRWGKKKGEHDGPRETVHLFRLSLKVSDTKFANKNFLLSKTPHAANYEAIKKQW